MPIHIKKKGDFFFYFGRLAQLGEHLPYKQGVTGSIPVSSIGEGQDMHAASGNPADLAQLVEHRSCKAGVEGSNPLVGMIMRT